MQSQRVVRDRTNMCPEFASIRNCSYFFFFLFSLLFLFLLLLLLFSLKKSEDQSMYNKHSYGDA
jgi:uncharacterized protein YpmS